MMGEGSAERLVDPVHDLRDEERVRADVEEAQARSGISDEECRDLVERAQEECKQRRMSCSFAIAYGRKSSRGRIATRGLGRKANKGD